MCVHDSQLFFRACELRCIFCFLFFFVVVAAVVQSLIMAMERHCQDFVKDISPR